MDIRNIAIIAHVDHGKTTLTDAMLRQTGAVQTGISMDSNALEQERGITIYSKNASALYPSASSKRAVTKINIVDTPGHADFGSEVERVLRSIDCVLLVVDAQEGPMPQTRFVLKKSLALGLRPILVINKIDKPNANVERVHDQVFDLFSELGANSLQLDFPVVYASAREGVAKLAIEDDSSDLTPLLDTILSHVPIASGSKDEPFRAQPFNLAYDNFLGRLAIARVYEGSIRAGDMAYAKKLSGETTKFKITKLYTFEGVSRVDANEVTAGDIVMIAGCKDVYIGDTISASPDAPLLDAIAVDEPTITLSFLVNNSPFAGRDGTFVTGRQLRERLEKELEVNVGLKIDFASDQFTVYGRGELHIAILLETMRREGYELQVSQPQVIVKKIDGANHEPFEEIVVDVPSEYQGMVIEELGKRGAKLLNMEMHEYRVLLNFEGPSRGLFGYRSQFVIDTRGEGILANRVIGYKPCAGEIARREVGSMVSQETGKALAYSLANLQTRGTLYIIPGTEVYEGMVIGNTSKGDQMTVNPIKGKHLTNMRESASDDAIQLFPARAVTIEGGLEIMDADEYLEITPKNVRLRKKYLTKIDRARAERKANL